MNALMPRLKAPELHTLPSILGPRGGVKLPAGFCGLPVEVIEAEDRARRNGKAKEHWERALPSTFASLRGDQLLQKAAPALRPAKSWTPATGNLILVGDSGVGKSAMAAYVFKATAYAMSQDLRRYIGDSDFEADLLRMRWVDCRALAECYAARARSEEWSVLLDACRRAYVLVVDDLGQDGCRAAVNLIFSQRYDAGGKKATVVTTSLRIDQIREQYGEDIERRLLATEDRLATYLEAAS